MSPLQAAHTVAGSCYAGPSSSHLGQPAGGDLLVWLLSTLPGEPGCAPEALLLSAQGQHLSSEQGHGRLCSLGKGPQRIRQNNVQLARTRSKTAFFPTAQKAFVQTLGNTLTWISDQRCLRLPGHKSPVCSDQSHQEGRQAERADFWRTNRDSCVTQTPTWESPPRRPEAGPRDILSPSGDDQWSSTVLGQWALRPGHPWSV